MLKTALSFRISTINHNHPKCKIIPHQNFHINFHGLWSRWQHFFY